MLTAKMYAEMARIPMLEWEPRREVDFTVDPPTVTLYPVERHHETIRARIAADMAGLDPSDDSLIRNMVEAPSHDAMAAFTAWEDSLEDFPTVHGNVVTLAHPLHPDYPTLEGVMLTVEDMIDLSRPGIAEGYDPPVSPSLPLALVGRVFGLSPPSVEMLSWADFLVMIQVASNLTPATSPRQKPGTS